ncbi:MAG: presqualene diphosphate synthase HpnD [Acidobacteriota bacterium]
MNLQPGSRPKRTPAGPAGGFPSGPPRSDFALPHANRADAAPAQGRHGAQAYCRRLTRSSQSNFYYSFLLLPRARRRAIIAVYAFCRAIDDAVDGLGTADPAAELQYWRGEIRDCFAGRPNHPIARQIHRYRERFELREEHFLEIVRGVEMDLEQNRYERFEDLYRYCYRVAGVVGLVCAQIFGHRDPGTRDYAISLGIGFQLVNILRDLRPDAARGRLYLPLEDLWRFGCDERELLESRPGPAFESLMRFECGRARETLRHARTLLPRVDRFAMWPAEAMGGVYERLLDKIETCPRRVFEQRLRVPRWRKVALALAARIGYARAF